MIKDISAMVEMAQQVHQEVLELITALVDDNSFDNESFVRNSSIFVLNHLPWSRRLAVCFPTPNTGLLAHLISQALSHILKLELLWVVAT